MGKHNAPPAHPATRVPVIVKVASHKVTHVSGIVVTHVAALAVLGKLDPVLSLVGVGGGH